MARITTYPKDGTIQGGDKWIITDIADGATKNIAVEDLGSFFKQNNSITPNNLSFIYDYESEYVDNNVVGQGKYQLERTQSGGGFAFVTRIAISTTTSTGASVLPIESLLVGENIQFANLTDRNSYGFYRVSDVVKQDNQWILSVQHVGDDSSTGTIPDKEGTKASITLVGVLGDNRGVRVFEGMTPPTGEEEGVQPGDIFIQDDGTNVFLYVYQVGAWDDGVLLTGERGASVDDVTVSQDMTTGEVTLNFFVEGDSDPVASIMFNTTRGLQGFQGVGLVAGQTAGGTPIQGQPTTFTLQLQDPSGATTPADIEFTVPAGADGTNFDPSLLSFTEGASTPTETEVLVNYTGQGQIGSFTVDNGTDGVNGNSIRVRNLSNGNTTTPTTFQIVQVNPDGDDIESTVQDVSISQGPRGESIEAYDSSIDSNNNTTVLLRTTDTQTPAGSFIVNGGVQGPPGALEIGNVQNVEKILFDGDVQVSGAFDDDGDNTVRVTVTDAHGGTIPSTSGEDDGDVLTIQDASTGTLQWSAPYSLSVYEDEGTSGEVEVVNVNSINFTGTGVEVTQGSSGEVNVNITGGSGPGPSDSPRMVASGPTTDEVATSPETLTLTVRAENVTNLDVFTCTASFPSGSIWSVSAATVVGNEATFTVTAPTSTVNSDTITIDGTYTVTGDVTVNDFPAITRTYRTFEGWYFGQDADQTAFPSGNVNTFFTSTLSTGSDQGEFSSPESVTATLSLGKEVWFAFPGNLTSNLPTFQNEGRTVQLDSSEYMYDSVSGYTFIHLTIGANATFIIIR